MSENERKKSPMIFITRMQGGNDEWEVVWGFDPEKIIAFLNQGKVEFRGRDERSRVELESRLDDDVWVIRGMGPGLKSVLYQELDKIAWEEREVFIKIHLGGGRIIPDTAWRDFVNKLQYTNTRRLLEKAESYNLGTIPNTEEPIVKFATIVREGRWDEYQVALAALKVPQAVPLHVRASHLLHTFSNILSPINYDLQGLVETDFRESYWDELMKEYETAKPREKLQKAKQLLYGQDAKQDTVKKIANDAAQRYGTGEWAKAWSQLQQQLPENESIPGGIELIFERLENKSNREIVGEYFRGGRNPVLEWIASLDMALSKLRDELHKAAAKK